MVSHVDVVPTLYALLDLPREDRFQGISFLPLVNAAATPADGTAGTTRTAVFTEVNYHAAEEPMRCIRTARHAYIRRYPIRTHPAKDTPVLANCDDSPSKDCWLAAGWDTVHRPSEELYDLTLDPNERHNLIDSAALDPVRADLRRRLDAWMADTADPLLESGLPLPATAMLNSPDARSPLDGLAAVRQL
jgi:arylsulfatase A-like enzyme